MWALSVELTRFLEQDPADAILGEERKPLQDASHTLNTQLVQVARTVFSRNDFLRWQQWIDRYSDDLRTGDSQCRGPTVQQLWWSQNRHRVALMETAGSHSK